MKTMASLVWCTSSKTKSGIISNLNEHTFLLIFTPNEFVSRGIESLSCKGYTSAMSTSAAEKLFPPFAETLASLCLHETAKVELERY